MATGASDLTASVQQIDGHLASLNQTEGTMVTKIETAQQKVADEVKKAATSMNTAAGTVVGAASNMNQAAQKVDQAAQEVGKVEDLLMFNPQNMRQMTNDVMILTTKAKEPVRAAEKLLMQSAN